MFKMAQDFAYGQMKQSPACSTTQRDILIQPWLWFLADALPFAP